MTGQVMQWSCLHKGKGLGVHQGGDSEPPAGISCQSRIEGGGERCCQSQHPERFWKPNGVRSDPPSQPAVLQQAILIYSLVVRNCVTIGIVCNRRNSYIFRKILTLIEAGTETIKLHQCQNYLGGKNHIKSSNNHVINQNSMTEGFLSLKRHRSLECK